MLSSTTEKREGTSFLKFKTIRWREETRDGIERRFVSFSAGSFSNSRVLPVMKLSESQMQSFALKIKPEEFAG